MKKILIILLVLIPLSLNAQKFYLIDELNVTWKYWDNKSDWDFLVNNGTKLQYSCIPTFQYRSMTLRNPIEIIACHYRNKKFLIISFTEEEENNTFSGIRIRNNSLPSSSNITLLCEDLAYVKQLSWYEIDFDNIVYDSWFDRVMIPIGIDPNGYHHAICIGFSDTQSLNSATIDDSDFNEDNVQYFNLKGEPIDINSNNNGIIIKTDGKKSVKFFK